MSSPHAEKRDPCQGQSHDRSTSFHVSAAPMWGHSRPTRQVSPSSPVASPIGRILGRGLRTIACAAVAASWTGTSANRGTAFFAMPVMLGLPNDTRGSTPSSRSTMIPAAAGAPVRPHLL